MYHWKKSNKILLFLPVIYFVGVFEFPSPPASRDSADSYRDEITRAPSGGRCANAASIAAPSRRARGPRP